MIKVGDLGKEMYLVESGKLEAYLMIDKPPPPVAVVAEGEEGEGEKEPPVEPPPSNPPAPPGKQFLSLKFFKRGDVFGELSILYRAPRAANVQAATDCKLWRLSQEHFN